MEHRYILQPYTMPSSRHTCPSCGHAREFALYVDIETGEPLHLTVGRCNREKSCGYHYKPKDFFRDNPEYKTGETVRPRFWTGRNIPAAGSPSITFLSPGLVSGIDGAREQNNLYRFFVSRFGDEAAAKVFDRYRVRTSKHFCNAGGLAAAFPQIDRRGRLRQLKIMAYDPGTGKRLKKENKAERWSERRQSYYTDTEQDKTYFAGKMLAGDSGAYFEQCYFGEHLIRPSSVVGIVESEKTALIASIYIPGVVWVASGGKNGVRGTKTRISEAFSGVQSVTLYPDLGCLDEWRGKMEAIRGAGITASISETLEQRATPEERAAGLDIADYLLRENPPARTADTDTGTDDTIQANENRFVAYIDRAGRLYIPTPPDGSTYTLYESPDIFEAVRSGKTGGMTRARIIPKTGAEDFIKTVML